jgi:FKBP-type peptidyl-prolyl cis-trans isomerase FkpA
MKSSIILLAAFGLAFLYACGGSQSNSDPTTEIDASLREEAVLQQYFKENKLNPTKHKTGFYYLIPSTTGKLKASTGDTIALFFKGNLLYAKTFVDSSRGRYPNSPIDYRLNVITTFNSFKNRQAFHDASALLAIGDKGTFFFPSRLMYGNTGALGGLIAPNTPLVYEMDMENIKKQ